MGLRKERLHFAMTLTSRGRTSKCWPSASFSPCSLPSNDKVGDRNDFSVSERELSFSSRCVAFGQWYSSRQFLKQRLRLDQIFRIEAFGEPVVDGRKQIVSLLPFSLALPEPSEARRGA